MCCRSRPESRWRLPLLAAALLLGGCLDRIGGHFAGDPEDAEFLLTPAAQALLESAYGDVASGALRDFHTHLMVHQAPRAEGWINPRLRSWRHPIERLRSAIYFSAAAIDGSALADRQYLSRLARLIRSQPRPGLHYLLAFDRVHDVDGRADDEASPVYIANAQVLRLAQAHPALFRPAMSVHPYRLDAAEAINRWADAGVRLMKWLPNVQGFDPADERLLPLYRLLAERDVALLVHTGAEQAMDGVHSQEFGNPLRLRPALLAGVTVVMAHAASLGTARDLDHPEQPQVPALELFLRVLDDPRWRGRAFGELSATTQLNRIPDALNALLQRPDLHDRLVNGSDYPLPAVNAAIHLGPLQRAGFLDPAEVAPLREIYRYNPLAFDYVLKRRLRLPGTTLGFAPSVFTGNGLLAHNGAPPARPASR